MNTRPHTGTGKAGTGPHGFYVSPKVRKKLRQTFSNGTGSAPLWSLTEASQLLGHPAGVSEASPDALTKGTADGVCSAITFGQWSELFVGFFGRGIVIDVTRDKTDAINGMVQVHASAYVDVGVRNPKAFAAMKDALCS